MQQRVEKSAKALLDEGSAIVLSILLAFAIDALRGTVDALTSSGKPGILRDRELREALTTFVNLIEDAVEDRFYMAQMSLTVWNEIARSGGPWRIRLGNPGAEASQNQCHTVCSGNQAGTVSNRDYPGAN